MADEIHKNDGLRSLIQREVQARTSSIVEYLKAQDQRFFNTIIIGIYEGAPTYQELDISSAEELNEEELEYLGKTFGILTLSGEEKLFAIDGQHRTKAIKDAVEQKESLKDEEISIIFLAHRNTPEGLIRTRRVFSTLNRYAKPVSKSEIIAIDEEDNCAIITRNIVEDFDLLKGVILFNKTRSINLANTTAFTNIIVLYDMVTTLLTDQNVFGTPVNGQDHKLFTHRRASDHLISEKQKHVELVFRDLFRKIPSLIEFLEKKNVDRRDESVSLLFKPVGQNVLYSTLAVAISRGKRNEIIEYFATDTFNLSNESWRKIFLDSETGRIKTDKSIQKYAFKLILRKIGLRLSLTQTEQEVFDNFDTDLSTI